MTFAKRICYPVIVALAIFVMIMGGLGSLWFADSLGDPYGIPVAVGLFITAVVCFVLEMCNVVEGY